MEDVDEMEDELNGGSPSASSMFAQTIKKSTAQEKQDLIFVNLLANRESYTAYNESHIWRAIYEEICMLERVKQFGLDLQEQCREETLLYQAISGLHASINMHVAANYYDQDGGDQPYMNHSMYYHSLGKHPERLKNMHFVYALVVRAVNRVHEQLLFNNYTTGLCEQNDQLTLIYMTNLLAKTISECSDSFNETRFFKNQNEDFNQKLLLDELQAKFYNISKIFDCIGCDKCRFNGKV